MMRKKALHRKMCDVFFFHARMSEEVCISLKIVT